MTPREAAQIEAEKTYVEFLRWTKIACTWIGVGLLVVIVGCNNGVETGKNATGSKYNGEVYSPTNVGDY
tara:strand:+ start:36 stop:242 length:207 start_codon:yes stop_codon:yes gene_type:complete